MDDSHVKGAHSAPRRIGGRRGPIGRCGAEETRTPDPLLAKEVLYQLSYGPEKRLRRFSGRRVLARERSERALQPTRPHAA